MPPKPSVLANSERCHCEEILVKNKVARLPPKKGTVGTVFDFDSNITVTSNFAMAWYNRVDLIGTFRKKPAHWLLVCDETGEKKIWKLCFCPIQDSADFKREIKKTEQPNEEKKMYLLRATSELKVEAVSGDKTFDPSTVDPEANLLLAQAFFFSGDYKALSQKKWILILDESLPQGKAREAYRIFFEEKILQGKLPEDYKASPLYECLRKPSTPK
jgi:hypothetical protein